MKSFRNVLLDGRVLLYGYKNKYLPDDINIKTEKVLVYAQSPRKLNDKEYSDIIRKYHNTQDIGWNRADLVFLDNEAIKGLVIGFPSTCPYVLVSLDRPQYWFWLIIGMIRRLVIGQARIEGIVRLKSKQNSRSWLVLNGLQKSSSITFSSNIGIQGLLDHLSIEKIDYVVMRFYQKLPQLHRKGGDLDLLVSDKDEKCLNNYIMKNPGSIRLDIWSVSAPTFNGISYYLPHLAEKILKNSIIGPANSRIPSSKDSLLSLIYHALYHKGVNSGILSKTKGIESVKIPKNDYIVEIQKMAREQNINVGSTMEELDDFLLKEGWRPKIDTLAKIAQWNEWVTMRYFSTINKNEFSVSIFIFRQKAIDDGLLDMVKSFIKDKGFNILKGTFLSGDIRVNAIKYLRGGTWKDNMFSSDTTKFEPAYAIVVVDMHSNNSNRFVNLKNKIRLKFDSDGNPSIVHSTDDEVEFWDYVNYCFVAKEINEIKRLIEEVCEKKQKYTIYFNVLNFIRNLPYYKSLILSKLKENLIKIVIK